MNQIEHKVGIKILDENQLRNVMPTYDNLIRKIEACRDAACQKIDDPDYKHYQYNFIYDNVFSILGQRGTGKTSVAFTLRKRIESKYLSSYYDVVLPIIIPEVIPENCTVIGWILAIVKEEIQKLDDELRDTESEANIFRNSLDRCRYSKERDGITLMETYNELSEMLYAGSYNPSSESSYYRAVGNSVKQADNYYQFAKKIAELWDAWIACIKQKYLREKGHEMNLCPMIYFIFDDVDLAPSKIRELLSIIVKYLSHPNIIVIATCDEELVLEVIENRLDSEIGRLPKEWRAYLNMDKKGEDEFDIPAMGRTGNIAGDLVGQTTKMYLGKVFPPSTRYYLQQFRTAKQKEMFRVTENDNLGTNVKEQIEKLLAYADKGKTKPINFMCNHDKIINIYLRFVGSTSRQINNVHIAIKELVQNLITIIKNSRESSGENKPDNGQLLVEIYQDIRYFMCISINANHELSNRIGHIYSFVDEVFLLEYNDWKLFCNYHYLNKYLRTEFENETMHQKIKIAMELYSLMHFVENILVILECCIDGGITNRKKVHGIVPMNGHLANDVFGGRFLFRTDLEPNDFFYRYMDLLNNLEVMAEEEMSNARFDMEYFYMFRGNTDRCTDFDLTKMYSRNQKWFKDLSGMLTMVYGNVYLINTDDIEELMLYAEREYLIRYQRRMDTELRENIRNCFMEIKMQNVWNDDIKPKLTALELPHDEYNSMFDYFAEEIRSVFPKEDNDVDNDGKTWIRLGQIFDETVGRLQDWLADNEKTENFPKRIMDDLYEAREKMIADSSVTKNLMLRYMGTIARTFAGQYVRLNEVGNAIEILSNCSEQYLSMAADIRDMQRRIMRKADINDNVAKLDRKTYNDFIKLLITILKRADQKMSENNYWSDEPRLIRLIQGIFADMDAVVELSEDNVKDFYNAVAFCTQFAFVQGLQRIYLFQSVHERYEKHSSRSSADIEVTKGERTYYKQIFDFVDEILINSKPVKKGQVVLRERMRTDIMEAVVQARNNYFDAMLAEMSNE